MKGLGYLIAIPSALAVGFTVGYSVSKKGFDKQLSKEVEELNKYFEEKNNKPILGTSPNTTVEEKKEEPAKSSIPITTETSNVMDYYKNKVLMEEAKIQNSSPDDDYDIELLEDMQDYDSLISEGYDSMHLTYYSDGYIVDDQGYMLDAIDTTIGYDAVTAISDHVSDGLYVANHKLLTVYEIDTELKRYSEDWGDKRPKVRG